MYIGLKGTMAYPEYQFVEKVIGLWNNREYICRQIKNLQNENYDV